jgi:hypothetical protein
MILDALPFPASETYVVLDWHLACAREPDLVGLRRSVGVIVPMRLPIVDAEIERRARLEAE